MTQLTSARSGLGAWVMAFAFVLATMVTSSQAVAAVSQSRSARTKVAVIIANNHGLAHEGQLRYAESDGRRMARALTDLGGYDDDKVYLLLGKTAAEVTASLKVLEVQLRALPAVTVMLYYSGHSDGDALHLSGTRLPKETVHSFLDGIEDGVRIALLDACKSGNMLRAKGMRPAPAFDIQVQKDPDVKGKIVITSSGDDEVAQESDVLQGSFFTHFFVTGLYGQADKNDDGRVTLEEAYRFAHYNTVQKTIAAQGGVQHPTYLFSVEGEGDIVLSSLAKASATLTLEASVPAQKEELQRYFVLDDEKKIVLTEFLLDDNKRGQVRLPPGKYQVRKREASRLLATQVDLQAGEQRAVSDADMSEIDYQQALLEKGAVVEKLVQKEVLPAWFPNDVQLRLGVGIRQGFVKHMSPQTEVAFGTRFAWQYAFVEPRVSIRAGTCGDNGASTLNTQGDIGVAVGPRVRVGQVAFSGGVLGSASLMHNQAVACESQLFACKADPQNGVFVGALNTRAFGELGFFITDSLSAHLVAHGDLFIFDVDDPIGTALRHPVLGTQVFFAWTF